ncbi:hypothetical protein IWQ49_003909 [Labrenzia sp. EL_126]|nr:hypothetical protein [Labrenzia sp. EL_126]
MLSDIVSSSVTAALLIAGRGVALEAPRTTKSKGAGMLSDRISKPALCESEWVNDGTKRLKKVKSGDLLWGYLEVEKRKFHQTLFRLREIDKLLTHRHGQTIPDTDDVEWIVPPIAALFRVEAVVPGGIFETDEQAFVNFMRWLKRWVPSASREFGLLVWSQVSDCRHRPKADDLADALGVTLAERTFLNLTQIGACDVTTEKRKAIAKERKKTKDRLAKQEKRRKAGAIPRAQYEAESISRKKPWQEAGVSRATYYRRKAKQAGFDANEVCETKASRVCRDELLAANPSHSNESAAGATTNKKVRRVGRGRVQGETTSIAKWVRRTSAALSSPPKR